MQIWLRGMFRQIFSLLSVDGVLRISTILRNTSDRYHFYLLIYIYVCMYSDNTHAIVCMANRSPFHTYTFRVTQRPLFSTSGACDYAEVIGK